MPHLPRGNPPPPSTPPHPMGCWAGVVDIPGSCSHRVELAFVRIFAKCAIRAKIRIREYSRNAQFVNSNIRARFARTLARRTGCIKNQIKTGQTGCVAHSTPPLNCPMPMVPLQNHLPACRPWTSVSYEVVI
eukprot:7237200-Prymnesium_polylepis.1